MAIKISRNCTVYEEEKLAWRFGEWREMTPRGELVVRGDPLPIGNFDFQTLCESAKKKWCQQYTSANPEPVPYCMSQAPSLIDLDAQKPVLDKPMSIPMLDLQQSKWIFPVALVGTGLILAYLVFKK